MYKKKLSRNVEFDLRDLNARSAAQASSIEHIKATKHPYSPAAELPPAELVLKLAFILFLIFWFSDFLIFRF